MKIIFKIGKMSIRMILMMGLLAGFWLNSVCEAARIFMYLSVASRYSCLFVCKAARIFM
jgi:hypothetical protein